MLLDEIQENLTEIQAHLKTFRENVWYSWGRYLFISNIRNPKELSDEELSFLVLLDEKYKSSLESKVLELVKENLDEWYVEYGSYKAFWLHSINLSKLQEGIWELVFEDNNIDVVVHGSI